jgi:hypothetical protein
LFSVGFALALVACATYATSGAQVSSPSTELIAVVEFRSAAMISSKEFGPKEVTVSISKRDTKVPIVLLQDQFRIEAGAIRALIVWNDDDRVQVRILTNVKQAVDHSSIETDEVELLRLSFVRKPGTTTFERVTR